jgi:hypothetical protein
MCIHIKERKKGRMNCKRDKKGRRNGKKAT